MHCLDENTVAELFDGVLRPADRVRVEEHLDACADCRSLVAAIGAELSGPAAGTMPADARGPQFIRRGTIIGRYRITNTIGVGSMGVVYAAHDPQLDRQVALKRLRADDDGDPAVRRLLDEAKSMARLSHPNVVAIHDVIQSEAGMYIAMEYIAGQTLTRWLERERSVRERLAVFVQAGEGLAAAHAAGMVHRDFKPDNVLVAEDGRARVTDFGLASLATPLRAERSSHGQRTIVGTPRYMAPEQHRGEPADPRSDQFSFCVSIFEALFGHPPFRGDSMDELAQAAEGGHVELPSASASSSVPAPIRRAIVRGLARDPDNRHPSMVALLPLLHPPPRSPRRRVLGLGMLAVVGGFALVVPWTEHPPACPPRELNALWNDSRRAAVSEALAAWPARDEWLARIDDAMIDRIARWSTAHQQTCEATKVWQTQPERLMDARMACLERRRSELDSVVETLEGLSPSAGPNAIDAIHRLPPAEACLDIESPARSPPLGPEAAALESLIVRIRTMTNAGDFERAAPAAARVRELASSAPPRLAAEAALALAWFHVNTGQLEPAEAALYDALETAEEVGADELRAEALTMLTFTVDDDDRKRRYGAQAHALATYIDAPPLLRAQLWRYRGIVLHDQGAFESAVETHQRALEIVTDAGLLSHPEHPKALQALANSYRSLRHLDRAEATYRQAIDINQQLVGPRHPRVAQALHGLGDVLYEQQRYLDALATYERALETFERVFGPVHIDTAAILGAIATVQIRLERPEHAEASLERALSFFEVPEYRDHRRRATVLSALGRLYVSQERYELALASLTEGLDIVRRSTPQHPDIVVFLANITLCLIELERHELAITHASEAAALARELLGPEHDMVATALAFTGEARLALGRTSEAITPLEQALTIWGDPPPPTARAKYLATATLLVRVMGEQPSHRDRALAFARHTVERFEALEAPEDSDLAPLRAWIAARDAGSQ